VPYARRTSPALVAREKGRSFVMMSSMNSAAGKLAIAISALSVADNLKCPMPPFSFNVPNATGTGQFCTTAA